VKKKQGNAGISHKATGPFISLRRRGKEKEPTNFWEMHVEKGHEENEERSKQKACRHESRGIVVDRVVRSFLDAVEKESARMRAPEGSG
jgi:hypothetical protein